MDLPRPSKCLRRHAYKATTYGIALDRGVKFHRFVKIREVRAQGHSQEGGSSKITSHELDFRLQRLSCFTRWGGISLEGGFQWRPGPSDKNGALVAGPERTMSQMPLITGTHS